MRKNSYAIALAAAMTLGCGVVSTSLAQDMSGSRTGDSTMTKQDPMAAAARAPIALPPGIQVKAAEGEMDDIREALDEVTDQALSKDGFDNIVGRLVDRNRLGNIDEKQFANLNGIVDQIRKDWKAKYDQDFDLPNKAHEQIFKGGIVHGQVQDPTMLVNAWPLPATTEGGMTPHDKAGQARPAGERMSGSDAGDANKDAKEARDDKIERKSLEKGQNVAIYTMPTSHGMPQVTVSLVQEPAWHVDVPDHLSADRLRMNLEKHLTMVKDQQAQWPSDVNDAYSMVAHHVLLALYDIDASQSRTGMMDGKGTGG